MGIVHLWQTLKSSLFYLCVRMWLGINKPTGVVVAGNERNCFNRISCCLSWWQRDTIALNLTSAWVHIITVIERNKEVKSGSVATTNAPHKQSSTFSAIPPPLSARETRARNSIVTYRLPWGRPILSVLIISFALVDCVDCVYIERDTHAHANRMINLVHKMIGKDSKSLFRIIKLTVDRKIKKAALCARPNTKSCQSLPPQRWRKFVLVVT